MIDQYELLRGKWAAYICVDCDPEHNDTRDDNDGSEYTQPFIMVLPKDEPRPADCPRCFSHLPWTEIEDDLTLSNTAEERYIRRQKERQQS